MFKRILAVLAGFLTWSVLWVGGTTAIMSAMPGYFKPDKTTDYAGIYVLFLVLSIAISIFSGYITGLSSQRKPMKNVLAMGILLLVVGIMVQAQVWASIPLWYHLLFLGFLIPASLLGGRLKLRKTVRA